MAINRTRRSTLERRCISKSAKRLFKGNSIFVMVCFLSRQLRLEIERFGVWGIEFQKRLDDFVRLGKIFQLDISASFFQKDRAVIAF